MDLVNVDLVRGAYRKLKGIVYFDKYTAYLRTRIAKYEDNDIDSKIYHLTDLINSNDWEAECNRILKSIRVLTFPKSTNYANAKSSDSSVISNIHSNQTIVEKYNNFIDMNIEGLILSVIWIILIGRKIDSELGDNCYGNRLKNNQPKDDMSSSPHLFKPYFGQYESWRNKGLALAQESMKSDRTSTIVTMLDFTRFYYNVDLNDNIFYGLTRKHCKFEVEKRLNNFVYSVLKTYSRHMGYDHVALPIGFPPSGIIANIYLSQMDKRFAQLDGTIYYGRYVDDIMLIQTVRSDSSVSRKIRDEGPEYIKSFVVDNLCQNQLLLNQEKQLLLTGEKYLSIQKDKMRFFYFDKNGSDELIEKILADIEKNTSEFGFVPDDYGYINTSIQDIKRDDTVNKLRSITDVTIDKYELSKAIGKNILMAPFADSKKAREFIRSIEHLIDNKDLIDNFTLWEGILGYYIVSDELNNAVKFSAKIASAVRHLDEGQNKTGEYRYWINNKITPVKESLFIHFESCVARCFSLVWGEQAITSLVSILQIIEKYYFSSEDYGEIINLRYKYLVSRMVNKSFLPVIPDMLINSFRFSDDHKQIRLWDLECLNDADVFYAGSSYNYYPYVLTPFELSYSRLVYELYRGNGEISSSETSINRVMQEYSRQFDRKWVSLNQFFSVSKGKIGVESKPNNCINVAVANVKMDIQDIKRALKGLNRKRYSRYREIIYLTNQAVRFNSDVFVLPEAYVPFQYLKNLARISAQRQMLIICGVEHKVIRGNVWNLTCTMIPFEYNGIRLSIPFFRQKKHFSPEELNLIGSSLTIPRALPNTLFHWKGFSFATYCCYDLTNIIDRSEFKGSVDVVFGIEWNKDTDYFGNIVESLSRDLYCYCVQANMSVFGDSRIVQPAKRFKRDILRVKGGENASILVGKIDIDLLNNLRRDPSNHDSYDFKDLPAGFT